jgi:predicted nuclease with TOPRIM domain
MQSIVSQDNYVVVPKQVSDAYVQQGHDQAYASFKNEKALLETTYKRALRHSTEQLTESMRKEAKLKHELEEKTRELEEVKRQRSDANRKYARLVEGLKTLNGAHAHKHVEVE